jgi:hypothetical protein
LNIADYAYLEQHEPYSNLKPLICSKYSWQRLTQFPHGNNVLDAAASNTEGVLSRDKCVSSSQLNRPIGNKMSLYSH